LNYSANLNQTWQEESVGGPYSKLYDWSEFPPKWPLLLKIESSLIGPSYPISSQNLLKF